MCRTPYGTCRPPFPGRDIIGARNHIIHGYLGIDDNLIWSMVRRRVPELIPRLRALLEEAEGQDPTSAT